MAKWYEEAVFYHMYPIGMSGADRVNRQEQVDHRFPGLESWLFHARDLGCTAIYIGPLFESTSHGYDTRDYRLVDRRLGDNDDFRHFVDRAHELGLRIVVDGVFNHTGREFFAFEDIRKNREHSPYLSWYKGVNFGWNSPYNDGFGYEAWRNCFELAVLNLCERQVKDYLLQSVGFWIDEFGIDGIRLDCADCLDFGFLRELRAFTDSKKEDFWLMGEVIHGDYSRWIGNDLLHSVTNYELHKGLYSGHNSHNYFEIAHTIRHEFDEQYGMFRGCTLYSFVDNHDVDRIASKLDCPEHIYPVHTLLFTLPGIPSIYYGSEWGIRGKKEGPNDDPLRPAVDLEAALEKPDDPKLLSWVKTLGRIHRENPILATGRYQELFLDLEHYAFCRFRDDHGVIVAVNGDKAPFEMQIRVPFAASEAVDLVSGEKLPVEDGLLCVRLDGYESFLCAI